MNKYFIILFLFILMPFNASASRLDKVEFWAYQIQKLNDNNSVTKIVNSNYDMVVLEPTRSDKETPNFKTKKMVKRVKNSDKIALAYIDIGEAEEWRWYFEDDWEVGDPDFIITEDPDGWSENYPVAYWRDEWKDIMIYGDDSALQQVLDDGFDGIYMDWIEAYSDPDVKAAAKADGVNAKKEMVDFIKEIKKYARKQDKNFYIVAQNAAEICNGQKRYFKIIDAIAQENVSYRGKADVKWKSSKSGNIKNKWRKWDRKSLKPYVNRDIPVFSVDYATKSNKIDKSYTFALNHGYIPFVSRTPLSRLPKNRPPGYPQ